MTTHNNSVWQHAGYQRVTRAYQKLAVLISDEPRWSTSLASVCPQGKSEALANSLLGITSRTGRTIPLMTALIIREFDANSDNPGTLFRLNSVASRIMSIWTRRLGSQFLSENFGGKVRELCSSEELDLEVDPSRLVDRESPEERAAQNMASLRGIVSELLDILFDSSVLSRVPREIRILAYFVSQSAKDHNVASVPLIGGFFILRFFNPALAAPEAFDIISQRKVPSRHCRRNLILITKVIQNISNSVFFGEKEAFMKPLNDMLKSKIPEMQAFLCRLCEDPFSEHERARLLQAVSTDGISDQKNINHAAKGDVDRGDFRIPFADLSVTRPILNLDNLRVFDLNDFAMIHRLVSDNTTRIDAILRDGEFTRSSRWSIKVHPDDDFLQLLEDLGPPPLSDGTFSPGQDTRLSSAEKLSLDSVDERTSLASQKSIDATHLEKAAFLYRSGEDLSGNPVFYLIVNRVSGSFVEDPGPLRHHLVNVVGEVVNSAYSIVVDMSWSSISQDVKARVYEEFYRLSKTWNREQRKNLQAIYIVHPTSFVHTILWFIRAFTSEKLHRKVKELYNWKDLRKYIPSDKIALPPESQAFIARSYHVVKVNSKGKKQNRLIKLTEVSILNIDPRSHAIKNERLLSEIEEISAQLDSRELIIRFKDSSVEEYKSFPEGCFPPKSSNRGDLACRRYLCTSVLERDKLVDEIFELSLEQDIDARMTAFPVIKINDRGRHQKRVLRFTVDSILNLNGSKIQSEIQFAALEEATFSPSCPDTIILKLRNGGIVRKLISKRPVELLNAMQAGIEKYRNYSERLVEVMKANRINGFLEKDSQVSLGNCTTTQSRRRLSALPEDGLGNDDMDFAHQQ